MNEQDQCMVMSSAERELSAFLLSIQRLRGDEAARLAAEYWIESLEQLDAAAGLEFDWRKITIAAASRLAKETIFPRRAQNQGDRVPSAQP